MNVDFNFLNLHIHNFLSTENSTFEELKKQKNIEVGNVETQDVATPPNKKTSRRRSLVIVFLIFISNLFISKNIFKPLNFTIFVSILYFCIYYK